MAKKSTDAPDCPDAPPVMPPAADDLKAALAAHHAAMDALAETGLAHLRAQEAFVEANGGEPDGRKALAAFLAEYHAPKK